ncbi:hypothetical protein N7510_002584 [Penicillium lagena]|uniref:uncharacterized protein n=1 Tax=Penicillium lagena TaxID=94218 RepID=UPI00253F924D|nr:uncharacterized protein N7510_002584 [Penicillium lagena]KAJ5626275.1 hypothetical protein N7510_002584 [Penicillium lagena]
MGKTIDDRPSYLSSDDAKYSLGLHRGPLPAKGVDDSSQLEHVTSAGGLSLETRQLKRKEKLQRHWKRFWCVYLVGNVIFLAIFLPIFFLICIPAISQLVVNKSDLLLVNAAVMQPKPDSIVLTLVSALDLKIALPVRIEPITLNLFVRDLGAQNYWGDITIPGQTIRGNTSLGVTNHYETIHNASTWDQYVHNVVFEKAAGLSVHGETNSYLGVLKSHVVMDKTIVSPTLNKFEGFTISDSALLLKPKADGTNLIGNAMLPNPSVLTLQIGTIVLDIYSGDLIIGNATLTDVELKPGNNTFPLNGVLDLSTVLGHLSEVLKSQAAALKNGTLALKTITRSVVWNGTEVPYYTKAMHDLPLTAVVGVADILKNTIHHLTHNGGLNLTQIGQDFKSNSDSNGGMLGSLNTTSLASHLKQNVAVRDTFKNEHPIKRDAMIDTLANLYSKSTAGEP